MSAPAIKTGVWDQVLAFGQYQHSTLDGKPVVTVFDASTVKAMFDDFAAHPDSDIFYDKQHEVTTAVPGDDGQTLEDHRDEITAWANDGHALAWANALVMVVGGQVTRYEAHPGAPGVAPSVREIEASIHKPVEDGVYCYRARVTPRGADPKDGLAAFGYTSPYFIQQRDGHRLLNLTATNDPRMRGAALAYQRDGKRVAMQKVGMADAGLEQKVLAAIRAASAQQKQMSLDQLEFDLDMPGAAGGSASPLREAVSSLVLKGQIRRNGDRLVAASRGEEQAMADDLAAMPGPMERGEEQAMANTLQVRNNRGVHGAARVSVGDRVETTNGPVKQGTVTEIGVYGGDLAAKVRTSDGERWYSGDDLCAMRREEQSMEEKDKELMARCGVMESDSPAARIEKMAAYIRKMEEGEAKLKEEAMARQAMDVDPNNWAQNAAVHIKTGAEHSEPGSVTSGAGKSYKGPDKKKKGERGKMDDAPFAGKETPEEEEAEVQSMGRASAMERRLAAQAEQIKALADGLRRANEALEHDRKLAMQRQAVEARRDAEREADEVLSRGQWNPLHAGGNEAERDPVRRITMTRTWLAEKLAKGERDFLLPAGTFQPDERVAMSRMTEGGAGVGAPDPRGAGVHPAEVWASKIDEAKRENPRLSFEQAERVAMQRHPAAYDAYRRNPTMARA